MDNDEVSESFNGVARKEVSVDEVAKIFSQN